MSAGQQQVASSPAWLRIEGLSKRFGTVTALERLSLEVKRGEFFCLLGPSGCGKTTLLRIIAGFEEPDAGQVWLRGRSLRKTPPEKRSLGMVFQHYALFPHLTVFENVAFPLRAGQWLGRGRRPDRLVAEVEAALRLVKLEGLGDRLPRELSGGQAQRVALARALVREPDVILLDEPLSALDLKVRQAMREELKVLHSELGRTFVFVTHDQDEALSMATRVALMNNARIEQVGTPSELYRAPLTRFAAHFVGDQAFVNAVCRGRRDDRLIVSWHGQTLFPLNRSSARVGSVVDVMLRPEDLSPAPGSPDGRFATVRAASFRGADLDVSLAVGDEIVRMRCSMREFEALQFAGRIGVRVECEAGVAFDPEPASERASEKSKK